MSEIEICNFTTKFGNNRVSDKIGKCYTVGSQRRSPGWKYKNRRNFIPRVVLNTSAKQKLEDDYVICKSYQTIKNPIRLLLDSGSDLNLIKLSALKDNVMVYEQAIYQLKGITEHYITTLRSVNLQIQIGSDTRATEFHVVHSSFPVPHEGIETFQSDL